MFDHPALTRQFCQAKVEDLRVPSGGHEQVGRLDVAMNNALRMGGVQRVGYFDRKLQDFVQGKRLLGDTVL